jgi:signal transduction histidine kinase
MKLPVHSIRWRIQSWHGLLLALVLAGFGVTAWQLQKATAYHLLDEQLDARLDALLDSLSPGPGGPPPPPGPGEMPPPPPAGGYALPQRLDAFFPAKAGGYYFRIWSRTGAVFGQSRNFPTSVPLPRRGIPGATSRSRDGMRERYVFTPPGECLLAGVSEAPLRRELSVSAEWLGALGLVVLALGLTGGWWLASRAIAPIDRISAAAAAIAAGNLEERIPIADAASELGRLAGVLNDTFTKLAGHFEEQARFTSDAAHELRTPVSIILAQAQLALARPRQSEEYRETILATQRAAQRMHALIDSLLELSMLDDKRTHLFSRPCDLSTVAQDQLDLIRPLAEERGITLRTDLAPAPCIADEDRIAQVFANLLANAVKFNRPGGEISLATHRHNGTVVVNVADTGTGVAGEHLPHLFERFYRAEESRSRTTGGAGLGLAICKSIVEAHGGTLSAESTLGHGSIFTFQIPTAEAGRN